MKRVELGEAGPIDNAIADWRRAIELRQDDHAAAAKIQETVWSKIVAQVPSGTKTLYIAPDGHFSRVPWAALPIGKNRVLLDEYAVTVVPHGRFLLEHLRFPRSFLGPESFLMLGDVTYNSPMWPALPGSAAEIAALVALTPVAPQTLTKADASIVKLAQSLPKARYAHLATHGEFRAKEGAAERERELEARRKWREGQGARMTAQNPLGFVGLVLANGEVMTGLSLVDLPLENLKLVTLSACESGLGSYTGGEGVQGLQRAFHLAGCPNVIASLWKVNDAATAALMAKFYHELWINKKPPVEALREAQLTIYYHPELIPDLAGERGAPKLKEAVAAKSGEPGAPATGGSKRADTKLWAAFVLSGVGK